MHDDACIGRRSENNINASCMTISGGRTKQLDIFCRVTGFTSDFLSFIAVGLIQFFHRAIQLSVASQSRIPPTGNFLVILLTKNKGKKNSCKFYQYYISITVSKKL